MNRVRALAGPLPKRRFLTLPEFEQICEDALRAEDLFPSEPAPVRIDRFVEKHFKVQPSYDDLPTGLLGITVFGPQGVQEIIVSKSLDCGDKVTERRLRATFAHESGHGLFHADIFGPNTRPPSLFGAAPEEIAPRILCRSGDIAGSETSPTSKPEWWEYQANQAIGCLLMPRPLVQRAAESLLLTRGSLRKPILPSNRRKTAIQRMADIFDVNPVVAKLRLGIVFPKTGEHKPVL